MTYNSKLTSLHGGLRPIHPEQDRINFAPKLAEDIRLLLEDGSHIHFNKVYTDADETTFPGLSGTVWVVSDIDGWWNLSDPSIPNIERGFGDGSFDINGRIMARNITINGSILIEANDRATIATKSAAVRKLLLESFNLVKRSTWLIVEEDVYHRAAEVRLSGRPDISTVNSKGRIDFSIGLIAPDPIKYEWVDIEDVDLSTFPAGEDYIGNGYNYVRITSASATNDLRKYSTVAGYSSDVRVPFEYSASDWRLNDYPSTDGNYVMSYSPYYGEASANNVSVNSVTITNHGNENVYCIFRIFGSFFGPGVIKNETTGQSMYFVDPSNTSDTLVPTDVYLQIDTKNRKVNLGDLTNGLSSASYRSSLEPLVDWIYLQPGDNVIYFDDFGTGVQTNTPVLQVYWRSGWIG